MPIIEPQQASSSAWDVIVIGTGMGGGTLGMALAHQGHKVLFCEKGRAIDFNALSSLQKPARIKAGRARTPLYTKLGLFKRLSPFHPLIGEGVGGSSALYGMAMQRFSEKDMPSHLWPITAQDLEPYYQAAERLYGVRQSTNFQNPLTPANNELSQKISEAGYVVGNLSLAGKQKAGCRSCQSVLCARDCKRHAGNVCVDKAVRGFGAEILTECTVERLVSDGATVKQVDVSMADGTRYSLKSKMVILAAGAVHTPALLLSSPQHDDGSGLANSSGLVGRYLMRHYTDLYAVRTGVRPRSNDTPKQLDIRNVYEQDGEAKASLQSFGFLFDPKDAVDSVVELAEATLGAIGRAAVRGIAPLLQAYLSWIGRNFTILATIICDSPNYDNRVSVSGSGSDKKVVIDYNISKADVALLKTVRGKVGALINKVVTVRPSILPTKVIIPMAEDNRMLAHCCGTCRMGNDPKTSVVNRWNKAHDLDNLYVVDASFFPSSGSTNPSLTIAANALRVAEHVDQRLREQSMQKDGTLYSVDFA